MSYATGTYWKLWTGRVNYKGSVQKWVIVEEKLENYFM